MENENQLKENKMGTMPVVPLLISMALPPMLSMFMQYTYNTVDCIFVSWLSEEALSAVSLAFPISTLIIALSIGIGVGTNVLVARALGRNDQSLADNIVSHSLILATVFSIAVSIAIIVMVKPFYSFFTDDPLIYKMGVEYTTIIAFMVPGTMIHISIQKIIQGTGNMIAPMIFQMAGVLLNFILDPLLIFGLLGFPKLGIRGAAIGTLSGYYLSMILAFYVLIFTKQRVKIKRKDFKIDFSLFKSIFVIGLPSLIMNALGAVMVVFANIFLIAYSMTAIAFFGIYFKIQQLIVMTVNGLIQGALPIMSYNFGAKNHDRLRETFKKGTIIAIIMMGIGMLLLCLLPVQILNIFKASDAIIAIGVKAMRIMSLSYIFAAIGFMFGSYFQATGKVKYSLVVNLLRQLLILVPAMWVLTMIFHIDGVWYSFLVAEFITAIVCLLIYRKIKV